MTPLKKYYNTYCDQFHDLLYTNMNLGKSKTPPSSTTAIPPHTTSALPYVTVPDNEGDRCDNTDDLRSLLVLCSQEKTT